MKVGDLVRLKAHRRIMVVCHRPYMAPVDPTAGAPDGLRYMRVPCTWQDDMGVPRHDAYPADCLEGMDEREQEASGLEIAAGIARAAQRTLSDAERKAAEQSDQDRLRWAHTEGI